MLPLDYYSGIFDDKTQQNLNLMSDDSSPPLLVQVTWTATTAGTVTELKHGEEVVVSYLPLSHVAAQVNDMWICMRFAATTYFAEPDALKVRL